MVSKRISITEFIALAPSHLVIDVRSPSEYNHAHYPSAVSLPLFDDEERKVVGTTYKQNSRAEAIKIGLDYFGVKMRQMVETIEQLLQARNEQTIIVHCWRGGMRSGAVSWLLALYGFKVMTLEGGYKAFRNWVLEELQKPHHLRVLGGNTGSGKTEILHELRQLGESIIDLEGIAGHKGSAFGALGLPPQGSTEFFENKLALELHRLQQNNNAQKIWIESESRRIGAINIHHAFFAQMLSAPYIMLKIPFEKRLDFIMKAYGHFSIEKLEAATLRIRKRLGGLETQTAIAYLKEDKIRSCFDILLRYYDKFYDKSNNEFQTNKLEIHLPDTTFKENAIIILNKINKD